MIKYICAGMFIFCTSTVHADTMTADAQRMLNRLGFSAGAVDGAYGRNTRTALEQFYSSLGQQYDGNLDTNEIADLTAATAALPPIAQYKNWDLEDLQMEGIRTQFWFSSMYKDRPSGGTTKGFSELVPEGATIMTVSDYDYDGDGIRDKIMASANIPENHYRWSREVSDAERSQTGWCEGECRMAYSLPMFFKGLGNGEFQYVPGAIRDNRRTPGMSNAHRVVPADYNGDGQLDFLITDHGWEGAGDGYRGGHNAYYLSQADGTWLESSETHFNRGRRWENFDHGATAGDVDGDGDIDIALTTIHRQNQGSVWCLINDSTGNMTPNACSRSNRQGWGLAVQDLDADGCNDMIAVGTPDEMRTHFSGVLWGNCSGSFKGAETVFPTHATQRNDPHNWADSIAAWTADLDGDGDSDVILSVHGTLYVGAGLHIIENLGDRQFRDHGVIEYNPQPATAELVERCHGGTEGNNCGGMVNDLHLTDTNRDGRIDLAFQSGAGRYTNKVLVNQGNFTFSELQNYGFPARHLQ